MKYNPITVPDAFAQSTITREGEEGRRWIAKLPDLIVSLCQQWQLTIEGPVMHGYLGLVVPVQRGEEACVLKLSWINETTTNEVRALSLWQGNGSVRLLKSEPAAGAILLERLDYHRSLNELPIVEAIEVGGRLLRRLAVPTSVSFPRQQTMAQEIAVSLPERWRRYGRPFPKPVLDHTSDLARQLTARSGNLMINYDISYDNVLAGEREPWLAIDPKVAVGEAAFGLAQLLFCRLEDIEANGGLERHFQILIEAAELEPEIARAWTLVRTVDYWLWGLSVGLTDDPVRCETIVTWLS